MATAEYSADYSPIISGSDVVYDNICQPCKNDGNILEAVGRCEDCDEYLCKSCFLAHTVPSVTRHHVMIYKGQLPINAKTQAERRDQCTQRCSEHNDEIVKYYCPTHSFLGCSACIILSHRFCNGTIYIPDAAKDILNNPEYQEYKAYRRALQIKHKEIETSADERIVNVKEKQTSAIERIRFFRKEMNYALDKAEKVTIEQVEKMGMDKLTKLKSIQSRGVALKSELYTKPSELDGFENKKQFCNLFIALMKNKDNLKSADKQLEEIDCRHDTLYEPRFKPNYDLAKSVSTVGLGEIFDHTNAVVRVEHHTDIDVKSKTDSGTCWISSCAILPDNKLIVVDNQNDKIKMIDIEQKKLTGELHVGPQPWDATVTSVQEVAVTLPLKNKITFIQTSLGLWKHRVVSVNGECRGIAYNDNKLFVSFDDPVKVEVLDMKGVVLSSVLTNDAGNSFLDEPLYLAIESVEKTVLISNARGSNVLCLKPGDKVGTTYRDNNLKRPTGMAVDSAGMVYVCDWNTHTVHQITNDCKKKKVLMTKSDGLDKPYTISYCKENDMLFIGMRKNNIIKVFNVIRK